MKKSNWFLVGMLVGMILMMIISEEKIKHIKTTSTIVQQSLSGSADATPKSCLNCKLKPNCGKGRKHTYDYCCIKNKGGIMPQKISYIGSKIINATEMDEVTFLRSVKGQEVNQETQAGYLVEYPDGYKSWSPKKTFEEAYRPISDSEKVLLN